jgi:hypothetical protein
MSGGKGILELGEEGGILRLTRYLRQFFISQAASVINSRQKGGKNGRVVRKNRWGDHVTQISRSQ